MLSSVIPAETVTDRAQILLTRTGEIVERYIRNIPCVYWGVELAKYVIMPNHVHLLLFLGSQAGVSVPTVVRSLKRMVVKEVKKPIFQESYYDVIIRNDAMFQCEWAYIDNNPDKWVEDELYVADF